MTRNQIFQRPCCDGRENAIVGSKTNEYLNELPGVLWL